jgi:PAS domain S-box-containing protein
VGSATVLLRRQMRQVSAAEAAWRTEVAWRSAMEDSALVGLRARDAEGRLLYVNRTFCELVGRPAEQLIGLKPPMPYWPPESAGEAMQRSRRGLAGLAPREGYEAQWRHADGHPIEVMVFESPLVDAQGQQIGWMGSIIDITQRKRLEERERHQAEALAHQARLTTLGEVASALAHQLNQPLTAVAGYNAGVLRRLEQAGCEDTMVLQALRRQGEQAAEAGRIVRRIREFLTRRAPRREPAVLAETVRQAAGLLQRDLQRQKIQVVLDLPPDLPLVQADPVLIEQVLINLLRNAADELVQQPEGQPRQIRVSAQDTGSGFVRLDVDDSGPGLAGRTAEQLTTPFYSTKPEGMGMGLAICRSVIEVHHGAFDAGVSPLGGARFPVRCRSGGRTRTLTVETIPMTMPMVHLVDDEAAVRDALGFLLQSHGLATAAYADAPAFWRRWLPAPARLRAAGRAHGAHVGPAAARRADGAGLSGAGHLPDRPRRHPDGGGGAEEGRLRLRGEALQRRRAGGAGAEGAGGGGRPACRPGRRPRGGRAPGQPVRARTRGDAAGGRGQAQQGHRRRAAHLGADGGGAPGQGVLQAGRALGGGSGHLAGAAALRRRPGLTDNRGMSTDAADDTATPCPMPPTPWPSWPGATASSTPSRPAWPSSAASSWCWASRGAAVRTWCG